VDKQISLRKQPASCP